MFTQPEYSKSELSVILAALADFETKSDSISLSAQQAGDLDKDSDASRKAMTAWELRRKFQRLLAAQ